MASIVNNTENATLSNYDQFLTQQQEDERQRRLVEKEEAIARKVNAQAVSNIIKEEGPGPHVYGDMPEIERQRLLQNRDVTNPLRDENENPLTAIMLSGLEDAERLRRIEDREESVARKNHAADASDAIRREATTIKARFVKRPSLWKRATNLSSHPTQLGRVIYNNIGPASAAAGKLALDAASAGQHVLSDTVMPAAASTIDSTYGTAKNMASSAASTAASYIPSWSSLMHTASSIKDTVMHNIPFVAPAFTLADAKAAEELERERRMLEDKSGCAVGNARRVSQIVRLADGRPFHKAYPSGFHRYTNGWEERERTRRLANKGELDAHRMVAHRVSNMINQLGWPFIRTAKGLIPLSNAAQLAEAERGRTLSDQKGMLTSRFQANRVAGLIKDAFKPFDHTAMSRYTRGLEEKERRRRIKNADDAIHGAHKHAALIRNTSFFVPSSSLSDDMGQLDYANARKRSVPDLTAHQLPRSLPKPAGKKLKDSLALKKSLKDSMPLVTKPDIKLSQEITQEKPKNIDTRWMEEDERKSRIGDKMLQNLAMDNAHRVSRLINKNKGPYKQRAVSFKPDAFVIPATPSTISPSSLMLTSMPRTQPQVQHQAPVNTPAVAPAPVVQQEQTRAIAPEVITPAKSLAAKIPLPDSPYPEHTRATPLYETPFATATPPPTPTKAAPAVAQQTFTPVSTPTQAPVNTPTYAPVSSQTYTPQQQPTNFTSYSSFPQQQLRSSQPLQQQQFHSSLPLQHPAPPTTTTFTHNNSIPSFVPSYVQPAHVSTLPTTYQAAPTYQPALTHAPAAVHTTTFTPTSTTFVPTSTTFVPTSTTTFNTQTTPTIVDGSKQKLIDSVQRLYDAEYSLAEKERQKMHSYEDKNNGWARFRAQRHAAAAVRHAANAKRHAEWLASANPGMSAM